MEIIACYHYDGNPRSNLVRQGEFVELEVGYNLMGVIVGVGTAPPASPDSSHRAGAREGRDY